MDAEKCKAMESRLQTWLDGELPVAEQAEVGEHVTQCPTCRANVDKYRQMGDWVRQCRGMEKVGVSPEAFWNCIVGRLPRATESAWWKVWNRIPLRPRYQFAFAAAMGLLIIGIWVMSLHTPLAPTPSLGQITMHNPSCIVEFVETGIPEATLVTYHSESADLTVIWLFAENPNAFMTLSGEEQI